jgi:hypothetical protein
MKLLNNKIQLQRLNCNITVSSGYEKYTSNTACIKRLKFLDPQIPYATNPKSFITKTINLIGYCCEYEEVQYHFDKIKKIKHTKYINFNNFKLYSKKDFLKKQFKKYNIDQPWWD